MTYYSKYLKYKNKYLELKNMIGGDFSGNEVDLDNLWKVRSDENQVFDVTFDGFKDHYSQYCWISGQTYGLGFFLYKLKGENIYTSNKKIEHVKNGKYGLWHLKKSDIGTPIVPLSFRWGGVLKYKTTTELKAKGKVREEKFPLNTPFDWVNSEGGWIYNYSNIFYIAKLNEDLFKI